MSPYGARNAPKLEMRFGGRVLACLLASAASFAGGNNTIIQQIDQAQQDREAHLNGYTVTEHYTIRNSRFTDPADTVVNTTYVRGVGKTYQVVSRTGPSFLQVHVMDRILKEEGEMSRGDQRRNALVTSANYEIKPSGQETLGGRACDVIQLTPRAKSAHLLKGKAWLDAGTHVLVRIQGKPTASPAFMSGIPDVVRDYTQIDGFSLASRSEAISQSFLLGRTDLIIQYTNYRVNGSAAK